MVKTGWKWLAALLIFLLGSWTTGIYLGGTETKEFKAAGSLPVKVTSPGSVAINRNRKMNIVVQDILNDTAFKEANKGFTQNQVVEFDSNGDGNPDTKGLVLFNLDIYAYDATDPKKKDPGMDIKKRDKFTPGIHRNNPVVLEFNISDYRNTIEKKLGIPSKSDDGRLGIYYYEPSSGSSRGKWYPIEKLVKRGDISIKRNGDFVEMTIFRWPVDDRVHVGN